MAKTKMAKRLITMVSAMALTMAMSTSAFAAESTKTTTGYGTLKGTISNSGYLTVSVTKNNDNAYLTLGGTQVAKNGDTVVTQQNLSSDRGVTSYAAQWSSIDSDAYKLFGVHGVQGGNTYGAYAVYTTTSVD